MPSHITHDAITHPGRMGYSPPPKMNTQAPGIWAGKPAPAKGIPGIYSYPGGQGPTGPAPKQKV